MDRVTIDLADVKIFLDLGDLFGNDSISDTPDTLRCRCVTVFIL